MIDAIGRAHARWVMSRRTQVLASRLGSALPGRGRVLDIGAGDGRIDALLMESHRGLAIDGVDVLVRPKTCIPVSPFDGKVLPFADATYDWALFVDTLHHAEDPKALLAEGNRVSRLGMVIKDHVCSGTTDRLQLRFMDWVGNRPHGVASPCNYWSEASWRESFRDLGLRLETWQGSLSLYRWPAGFLFDRSLHFVAKLSKG